MTEVVQYAGQLFSGTGLMLHAGRTISREGKHEASNYFPVRWLLDGLPQCLDLLRLFCAILPRYRALEAAVGDPFHPLTKAVPFAALAHARTLMHEGWAIPFLSFLLADVKAFLAGRASRIAYCRPADEPERDDPHLVTREQLHTAQQHLTDALMQLHSREARAFVLACEAGAPAPARTSWARMGTCRNVPCPASKAGLK